MKILWFIPLLMLFVVLSGEVVSPFSPSPSVAAPVASSTQPWVEEATVATSSNTGKENTGKEEVSVKKLAAAKAPVQKTTPAPTTTPTSKPAPTQPTSVAFIAEVEAEILRLTNEERAKEGLSALSANTKLRDIAWAHSADMLANNYFDHDDPQGCSSSCRATNAGYRWRAIGENIYMMSGFKLSAEKTATMVVDGWMNSSGHRANILGKSFIESGVGVITDGKSVYVTAMYGKQR